MVSRILADSNLRNEVSIGFHSTRTVGLLEVGETAGHNNNANEDEAKVELKKKQQQNDGPHQMPPPVESVIQRQGHHQNANRAARRPHILCSTCFHSSVAFAKAVRLFIASPHNQPMYPKMCSTDIVDNLQLVG